MSDSRSEIDGNQCRCGKQIVFTPLTSCLTISIADPGPSTSDSKIIGLHLTMNKDAMKDFDGLFNIAKNSLEGRTPTKIFVIGVASSWVSEQLADEYKGFAYKIVYETISKQLGLPDDFSDWELYSTQGKGEVVSVLYGEEGPKATVTSHTGNKTKF